MLAELFHERVSALIVMHYCTTLPDLSPIQKVNAHSSSPRVKPPDATFHCRVSCSFLPLQSSNLEYLKRTVIVVVWLFDLTGLRADWYSFLRKIDKNGF